MASTKTARKPAAKTAEASADAPRRVKSLLTQAGDEAKRAAERSLLLKTLRAHDWNLTHTAAALRMGAPTAVLTAIDRYDLRADYEKARASKKASKQAS